VVAVVDDDADLAGAVAGDGDEPLPLPIVTSMPPMWSVS
jgi:hypothetical protein